MSLLEAALDALGDQVEDNADDWFERLTDSLDNLINDTNSDELRIGGNAALQIVKDNQDKFVALGKKSFILFVAHVAADRHDDAAKEYYRNTASARDIINSILNDAVDLEILYREREELKKDALELAKLLLKGAKFLLPFLLTLL